MADGATQPRHEVKPGHRLAHATADNSPFVKGRREFFRYRDLGLKEASGGQVKAQIMSAITGMTEPTGWHYHTCEAQFVYIKKGWVDLEFEDGQRKRIKAGESLFIPGGLKHNEFGTSDDLEILEVVLPGEMGTVSCEQPERAAPNPLVKAGHKLAHATEESAPLVKGRRDFFKYRDLGVIDASGGQVRAQIMTAIRGMDMETGWHYHTCEAQFAHILKGWVDLEFEDGQRKRVKAGEALFIPGGLKHNEIATSNDLEALEIVLPSEMGTVSCERP